MNLFSLVLVLATNVALPRIATAQLNRVPINYRNTSGTRPYVPVQLNGKHLLFMLHAGTDFYAMTTHANAAYANVTDLVNERKYGITKPGAVSSLQRASAHAAIFTVGGLVMRNMPIQVFEIPQTPPVDGMLGLLWLRSAKAFVDFQKALLVVPRQESDAQQERMSLTAEGYVAHPMSWDSNIQQFVIHPSINGVHSTFRVSTVSSDVLDEVFARARGIALVQQKGNFGGPSGTTGHFYKTSGAYPFQLDGQTFQTKTATVFDTYAYEAKPRPTGANAVAGDIGCDFMRANQAVIDFGSGTLYLLH